MLDFTSALYLGLRHASGELAGWARLTTGAPAALAAPPGSRGVARSLAALQGCERGTLAPSTLHLFWDLFAVLVEDGAAVWMDAGAYPVARWGVERVRARGVPARSFPHHDPDALRRRLDRARGRRPVVVADGLCPGCGGPAPVAEYLAAVRLHGGLLVLDDTQALGILGESPGPGAPYGSGGGGSLRFAGAGGDAVLLASSLAKGFGTPAAALCGSAAQLRRFEARSLTRVHCSPPSAAAILAAERALELNRVRGDALRLRLERRVRRFRAGLEAAGLAAAGGLFPMQTLRGVHGEGAAALHQRLLRRGVRAVLHGERRGGRARVSFLITAAHSLDDIDRAVQAVARAADPPQPGSLPCEATILGTAWA